MDARKIMEVGQWKGDKKEKACLLCDVERTDEEQLSGD